MFRQHLYIETPTRKMVRRLSYLYNGNPYVKKTSSYWNTYQAESPLRRGFVCVCYRVLDWIAFQKFCVSSILFSMQCRCSSIFIPLECYFSTGVWVAKLIYVSFLEWTKHWLSIAYLIHIWQVSPQLSFGDVCQIQVWIKSFERHFWKIRNIPNRNYWTELL